MIERAEVYQGEDAVTHLFSVASSIDSLVVGEREMFKLEKHLKNVSPLGFLEIPRVLIQSTIQTAKKYIQKVIATRPVSVVSLAYFELKKYLSSPKNILVVGAGKTISSMLKFISKSHEHQFSIYNRSIENAQKLAVQLDLSAQVHSLTILGENKEEIDVIITCTGSQNAVITPSIYNRLNPNHRKITIVDLAVPNDCDESIKNLQEVRMITETN